MQEGTDKAPSVEEDNLCIDCSILSNEADRKECEDLTKELSKGTIDLETFSNALIDMLDGDGEKFASIFCEPEEDKKTEVKRS